MNNPDMRKRARAAGPELYAALREIMMIHQADSEDFYDDHPGHEAYRKAEAVIAKVRGQK